MMGFRISLTSDVTILPKAAPMITPTARSITFPRAINFLNSPNMCSSLHQVGTMVGGYGESFAIDHGNEPLLPGGAAYRSQDRSSDPAQGARKTTHVRGNGSGGTALQGLGGSARRCLQKVRGVAQAPRRCAEQ